MSRRERFIEEACAFGMHAVGSPADRVTHAKHLKATAEALADELGLHAEPALAAHRAVDNSRELAGVAAALGLGGEEWTIETLAERARFQARRIVELEQDLEKATAPKGRAR